MRRASIALLLAAAAAARTLGTAAAYEDWNAEPRTVACTPGLFKALEVALPNIIMHEVGRIPSEEGAKAAGYLAAHPRVPLFVSFVEKGLAARFGRPYEPSPAVLMGFLRGRDEFTVAHRVLHLNGKNEQDFLADGASQGELVHALAASFVHETSHARQRERFGALPGFQEDELLSFYRASAFLLDAMQEDPTFDRLQEALSLQKEAHALCARRRDPATRAAAASRAERLEPLYSLVVTPPHLATARQLAALAESNERFEAEVLGPYKADGLPSLWGDAAAQARKTRTRLEEYEKLLRELAAAGKPPSPSSESTLRLFREEIAFWESPERLKTVQSEYARLLALLKAGMNRRRAAGRLKPFMARPEEVESYCRLDRF